MIEILLAVALMQESDASALVAKVEEKALEAGTLHTLSTCAETAKRGKAEFRAEAWFKGEKARFVLEGTIESSKYRLLIVCDGRTVVRDGGPGGETRADAPKDFAIGLRRLLMRGGATVTSMVVSRKDPDPGIITASTWKTEPDRPLDGTAAKGATFEHALGAGTKVTGSFWWNAETLVPLRRTLSQEGSKVVTEEAIATFELGGGISDDLFALPAERPATKLKALMNKLQQASASGDTKTAAAIVKGLVGGEKRLRLGLKPDVKAEDLEKIVAMHQQLAAAAGDDDAKWSKVISMGPKQTDVNVYEATTEEIDAYAEGSTAFRQFPGGTKRLASRVLRDKTTYYEVEFVEPGQRFGMKYHLFYWDGEAWTMLGPLWRQFREK